MKQILLALILCAFAIGGDAQTAAFTPPQSQRTRVRFDLNWRFIREDVSGAEAPGFDDSAWDTVSTPHTYNDVDTFDEITHHGEYHEYTGIAWYRKHFKLPAKFAGGRIFLEFEGIRQAGDISSTASRWDSMKTA